MMIFIVFLLLFFFPSIHPFPLQPPFHDNFNELINCVSCTNVDYVKFATSGAIAGGFRAISRGLTFPFDTIKTLQQAKIESNGEDNGKSAAVALAEVYDWRNASTRSNFFTGAMPTIISAIPANSVFFVIYNGLDK